MKRVFFLIILFGGVLFVNAQESHYYIGNDFDYVSEKIGADNNLIEKETIYYNDNSVAIYGKFLHANCVYTFNTDKTCIFYFIVTDVGELNRMITTLDKRCIHAPNKQYGMRWVDNTSPTQSIWKMHIAKNKHKLYIFVMDSPLEKDITELLEEELIIKISNK